MAVNKYPFLRNIYGADPLIIMGKVQAGSTQAIKRGEICVFNETSGYWVPANAAADQVYSLAISNEEQKADGLERYMEFIAIRDSDVFEFAMSSAAQAAYGYALEISDSQTLAYDADGNAVAFVVGRQNYPETGTTLGTITYVEVMFHPEYSYLYKNMVPRGLKKIMAKTAAYSVLLEDCGAIISNKGASGSVTLTAPSGTVPIGFWFDMAVMADQAFVFDPKPDTAQCYIKGAAQTAGKYVSVTDIGDYIRWVWDGTDWLGYLSISGADADISVET